MENRISIKPAIIASIALLILAVFPLPYGFYTLLRIVVFLTAGYISWFCYKSKKIKWTWTMGFMSLIFNPVIPLHFERALWVAVDLIAAIILIIYLIRAKRDNNE